MSQQSPRLANLFKLEYPQSVGTFTTYEEAQKAVDFLSDAHFPVENLAIVGTDLRSIERVLGRRTWGTVIGQGVQSGLSTGLMVAFLMWLFVPANFVVVLLSALGIGILIGILFAALGYWMSQGKRDFTSVSQTVATRYELLSEHKVASQAKELLAQLPGVRAAQFDPRTPPQAAYPQQPPAYPPPSGYPQPGYPQAGYPQGQPAYPPTQPPSGYPGAGYPAPYPPSDGYYGPPPSASQQPTPPASSTTPSAPDENRQP